ncbi:MAG TPA: methyltransferase domain-containing protein [Chloroflexota bacterium]|jgi:SAM-dependent methyltransferase
MVQRATDPVYLAEQYSSSERLRIRAETHRLYSVWDGEHDDPFELRLLKNLRLAPGLSVLDVGCGPGTFHRALHGHGVTSIVGLDRSLGMLREASIGRYAQADAQALPLPDASFDGVMANHMLFHVPDIPLALREMRRVARPGGRVVLTTNGADFMERLHEVHVEACQALGYEADETSVAERFTLDHLDLVRSVFRTAERQVLSGALVFPSAEAALRYYASGPIDRVIDAPPEAHGRLLAAVGNRIRAIVEREGDFRVAKSVGWFVADV